MKSMVLKAFRREACQIVYYNRFTKTREIYEKPELDKSALRRMRHDAHILNLAERSQDTATPGYYYVERIDASDSANAARKAIHGASHSAKTACKAINLCMEQYKL